MRTPWPTRPLAECGRLLSGGTPSKAKPAYWDGTIPWFSSKELKTFELRDSELHVSADGAASGSNLVPAGTVLFVVRGMSLANEFRVGLTLVESTFNQDVKAVVPAQDIHPRYLARCLRWLEPRVLSSTEESSHGTKRLPGQVFENLSIPVPPLPEQRRIADILDKADAIRRKRKEAIALTEELLRSAFLEMFGDPVTNPKGWPRGKMADLCRRITDGTHLTPKFSDSGIPFLFVRNVVDGRLTFETEKHIPLETYQELTRRCPIEVGDVLYVTVGATYGDAVVVETSAPFCFQRHLAHLKPDPSRTRSTFLHHLLRSESIKRQADRRVRGAAQPTLNLGELRDFDVVLPPLAAQSRFEELAFRLREIHSAAVSALEGTEQLFDALAYDTF